MQTLNEWMVENEKLCEKATPGPWFSVGTFIYASDGSVGTFVYALDESDGMYRFDCILHPGFVIGERTPHEEVEATAKLMLAARNSLPTALKIIRELVRLDNLPGRNQSIAESIINQEAKDGQSNA